MSYFVTFWMPMPVACERVVAGIRWVTIGVVIDHQGATMFRKVFTWHHCVNAGRGVWE